VTFEDLAEGLRRDYRNNGRKSANRIEGALKHLGEFFAGARAVDITRDAVERYKDHRLGDGAANATCNRELAALKRALRLAEIPNRPEIAMLKENNARKGFFERPEFDAVIAQLPAYWRAPFEVAYITGWRVRSEILTREWKHVDFEHGTLRLEPGETKNGEGRNFPMTAALRVTLERLRAEADEHARESGELVPWLFHRGGVRLREYRRAWGTACKRAGLVGRIAHDFRRTAVRNLERAGVPRSVAMSVVGHRTESIYRRYAIVDSAMQKDAAAKLDALHEADSGKPARVVRFKKTGKVGAKS
jgi:integrase